MHELTSAQQGDNAVVEGNAQNKDVAHVQSEQPAEPTPALAVKTSPQADPAVSKCFQCGKCSVGCPVAEMTDLLPHRIVRLVQLGQRREALRSSHIWCCTGCGTCSTRCPNQVEVAELMDRLKIEAITQTESVGENRVAQFHQLFNRSVCKFGRSHELGTLRELKTTREMLADIKIGLGMLRRGMLRIRPAKIRDRAAVREFYRRARMGK